MLVAAGLFELPLLATMAGLPWPFSPPWAALLHLAAATLVFLAPPPEKGVFHPTRHWGEPLGLMTLLVPGLGCLASAWLLMRHPEAPHDKEAYRFEDEEDEEVNPLAGLGTAAAIRREMADALEVLPAADALLGHDPAMKRGAIETLAKIRTLDAVRWIHMARSDADPEVRFFATTALTRLKHEFETSVQAAEKEAFRRPGELAPQLTLQRVRLEYAVSGMLDAGGRLALLQECRQRLEPLAERDGEALRLFYLVERQLDPARAFASLERLAAARPGETRWLREKAELLFALGRPAEVRALLKAERGRIAKGEGEAIEDLEWRSTALWWTDV